MAKLFDFIAISWEELGYFMKISINIGQMRYCCSISMKIWGNQYPEIFSVRRTTPANLMFLFVVFVFAGCGDYC